MAITQPLEIHRQRYWQGQLLRSRDFNDQYKVEAQLRWWHNRALHNVYGVSFGLNVSAADDPLTAVVVSRGVAYDCMGRELILPTTQSVALPEQPPEIGRAIALYVRYRDTDSFPPKKELAGNCLAHRFSTLLDQAELRWLPADRLDVKAGVPIARVQNPNNELMLDEKFIAPTTRAFARPHIASGSTLAGSTAWKLWERSGAGSLGYEVKVDTSVAGFTEVPVYFAWLQGRFWPETIGGFFFAPFTYIDQPESDKFVFRIWMPNLPLLPEGTANQRFDLNFAPYAGKEGRKLSVGWLGIQPLRPA